MGHCYVHFAFLFTLRAEQQINVLKTVARKLSYDVVNAHSLAMIYFIL